MSLLTRLARPCRRTFIHHWAPVQLGSRSLATSTTPSAYPTKLRSSPSKQYLEDEEIDVELIPPDHASVLLTERAAQQLARITSRADASGSALRVAVESGGCHGYQYKITLAKESAPDDYVLSAQLPSGADTPNPPSLLIDAVSLPLLTGSTLDYATELIGSSFRISENPHAKEGAGCGCGVSWELGK